MARILQVFKIGTALQRCQSSIPDEQCTLFTNAQVMTQSGQGLQSARICTVHMKETLEILSPWITAQIDEFPDWRRK